MITGHFVFTLASLWIPLLSIHLELVGQISHGCFLFFFISDCTPSFSFKSEPNPNMATLLTPMLITLWVIVLIILTCEYGERLTNQYDSFYDGFTQCDWYLFPLEVQQFLPLVISNIQQPAAIQGYAQTVYRREFCKMVTFLLRFYLSC